MFFVNFIGHFLRYVSFNAIVSNYNSDCEDKAFVLGCKDNIIQQVKICEPTDPTLTLFPVSTYSHVPDERIDLLNFSEPSQIDTY